MRKPSCSNASARNNSSPARTGLRSDPGDHGGQFKEGIKRIFLTELFDEDHNEFLFAKMELLNDIKMSLFDRFRTEQINVKLYVVFNGMESSITDSLLLTSQIADIKKDLVDGGYLHNSFEIIDMLGKSL